MLQNTVYKILLLRAAKQQYGDGNYDNNIGNMTTFSKCMT